MSRTTRRHTNRFGVAIAAAALVAGTAALSPAVGATGPERVAGAPGATGLDWATVVNNNDLMPPLSVRNFNSYNQPSVNLAGQVVIRARSRGGPRVGPPTHGIYTRDMSVGGPVVSILDRTAPVPFPNNLDTTFVETPSFPRIDAHTGTIATRGNHQPVWRYLLGDGTETRAGTTGIYANPYGPLVTGAAKLGAVPEFGFFEVPGLSGAPFEVFPGSPSVTRGNTIVFKGNYTDPAGTARTGVYFRDLDDEVAGGTSPVVRIADTASTVIPGTSTLFGSTAPPSAEGGRVVFAGFDNEAAPTLGGIYAAPLESEPPLVELVGVGERIPGGAKGDIFNALGEGVAFDGRFVAFWGAWGDDTTTLRLYCPTEGNRDRIDFCNQRLVCADTGEVLGAANITCDETGCYQTIEVPVDQGIFVHDVDTRTTRAVATTADAPLDDFLFWSFSGRTPCTGGGHSVDDAADDGEPARWRSSAFVAVAGGPGATYRTVFKARTGEVVDGQYPDPVDGIYLRQGPGKGRPVERILDTTMDGRSLDPEAPAGSVITELGLEREGLRGDWLAVSAKMGIEIGADDHDDMAGVYVARIGSSQP